MPPQITAGDQLGRTSPALGSHTRSQSDDNFSVGADPRVRPGTGKYHCALIL